VKFIKSGPKILLIQPNYGFRAISDNPKEAQSVEEAFAQSVIWGFKSEMNKGRLLIDATSFFLRDAHGVSNRLESSKQGSYKLDKTRSAIYLPRCKNFPINTEFEAMLTFTGKPKGEYVNQVVPSPDAITVRQHHSFVQLPDDKYEPRVMDPRCGYFGISYQDYATPISEPLVKHFINRHRLEKKNPSAAKSEAVEPIIYYLDPGAPEPIKSALLDGARWWNQAFEAAGFIDAFQVKILSDDADPLDVRYNVIQWVHRATRGWSYGGSVSDPRTGEILKGHVSLGSLRVRQDYLIAQGLIGPYEEGKSVSPEMEKMALARLRQLSAHEVGHTIGLAHNFAASTNGRASVMDYPHPYVLLNDDGSLDFSNAYDDKIGDWDKRTIIYGYTDFPENSNEETELNNILKENERLGFRYISDRDARPQGGAHPYAHLWDNHNDAVEELERMLEVRQVALDNFDEKNIRMGAPMSTLEEVLVPIYLSHRYQVEAVAKLVGGTNYDYAVRDENLTPPVKIVNHRLQKRAMKSLLNTLHPSVLSIDEKIINLIPPKPRGYSRGRESFKVRTGLTFDPIAAAESAANKSLSFLLNPQRAARLVEYHSRDKENLGLHQLLDNLIEAIFNQEFELEMHAELNRLVQKLTVQHMIALASNKDASEQVRAINLLKIIEIERFLKQSTAQRNDLGKAHAQYLLQKILYFKNNPKEVIPSPAVDLPAGSPIGCGHFH